MRADTMDTNGSLGIRPARWLAGSCLLVIACLTFAGLGAALGWAVFGVNQPQTTTVVESRSEAPARLSGNPVGQRAPAFTLQDVDGNEVSLDQVRGRPLLINFWATWCGPCRIEMPVIEDAYQQHQSEGLLVLAIDVEENPELARTFAGWLGVSFTILDDGNGDVAYRYHITAYPSSFFVDRDGVIRAWQVGAMSESVLDQHLAEILESN